MGGFTTTSSQDRGGVYYPDQTTEDNTIDEEDGQDYLNDFHSSTTLLPDGPARVVYETEDGPTTPKSPPGPVLLAGAGLLAVVGLAYWGGK